MSQGSPEPNELIAQLDAILKQADEERRSEDLERLARTVRPEDIADVLGHFPLEQKVAIFRALPPDALAEVMDETDWETTRDLVAHLSPLDLGRIVEQMPPDEATDLIADLPEFEQLRLLKALEPETAGEVRRLLLHHPESAGGIMTSDYIAVREDQTAGEVLEHLQKTIETEVVEYVHVVDPENHPIGVFSIRDLLRADPERVVRDFMTTELIFAEVTEDQEKVATLARKYNLKSIPIVDAESRLVGVATIDDILDILSEEADEDIYRMAGTAASHPAQQKVLRRAFIRIPWLFLPVLSGLLIAWIHQGEEDDGSRALGQQITLVAFIPLVMGIAGAVGTQSATMMVRGMATGDIELGRGKKIFMQELGIGAIIALAIGGLVTAALALLSTTDVLVGSGHLSTAVGTGLAAGIILASICGTLFPIGCEVIGLDPALVAGPFITSFNDVVAAMVYLGLAELVLHL